MNETTAKTYMIAILTALAEVKHHSSPESMLYMLVGHSLDNWNLIRQIMEKSNLITVTNHLVTLTAKGLDTGNRMNAILKSR